jgi:hypothetical protein
MCIVARLRLVKIVAAATNTHATIEELLDASFCMRSVLSNEGMRLVLPRTSCLHTIVTSVENKMGDWQFVTCTSSPTCYRMVSRGRCLNPPPTTNIHKFSNKKVPLLYSTKHFTQPYQDIVNTHRIHRYIETKDCSPIGHLTTYLTFMKRIKIRPSDATYLPTYLRLYSTLLGLGRFSVP